MGYIELIKDFWREHDLQAFSTTASLLYLRLLEECNRRRWRNPFTLSSASLEETVSRSRKMLCQAREELRERGLIDFVAVNRMPTAFMLLKAPEKAPEKEALSEGGNEAKCFQNVSKMFLRETLATEMFLRETLARKMALKRVKMTRNVSKMFLTETLTPLLLIKTIKIIY